MVCALQHLLLLSSGSWDGHVGAMGAMMKHKKSWQMKLN